VLLQLQAERLWARVLSGLGDHIAATICFKQVTNMATAVDIPLEIARTQASLAHVLIASGDMQQGLTLIAWARQSFVDHQALADLQTLE
jgi:hypothetical protein